MDYYVFCLEEVFLGFADFSAAVCTSFTSFSRLHSANWCISGSANICIPHTQSSLPSSLRFQERSVLMGWSEWAQSVKRVCETEWPGIVWWGGDHGPVSVCHLLCNQRNGWRYYSISWYRDSICSAISWGQHLSDIPTYIFKSLKDHLTMVMTMMGKLVSTGLITMMMMMMMMVSSWIDCWGNKKFQAPAGAGGTTNKAGNWAVRGWEEPALADIQQS